MASVSPRREDCVLRYMLERNAAERPDELFATFESGETWTRLEAVIEGYRSAHALAAAGLHQGDRVALMLRNGPDFLRAWFGANFLGASLVTINLDYKETMLDHVFATTPAPVLVHEPEFAPLLERTTFSGRLITPDLLASSDDSPPVLERLIEPWDKHCDGYTSGTTGPSKASITTHIHILTQGNVLNEIWKLDDTDTFLIDLPLFHTAAQAAVIASTGSRTRIAVRSRPAMSTYWTVAREAGVTACIMVSSMAAFLESQPPHEDDRRHSIRIVLCGPQPKDTNGFKDRFGIAEMTTCWASTESSAPITHLPGYPLPANSCGRQRPGYEVRLVDEHDMEVPTGQPGELIVRSDAMWVQSGGYVGRPDATAAAWRNGWFHTGDVLVQDEEGYFYFHDRVKDALRRRGENISSFEVERDVVAHPDVLEAACIGVPCDHGADDEVMVFLVVKPEISEFDYEGFIEFASQRMPKFMIPRYVEVVPELPKTATMRVKKNELRAVGVGPAAWDRERGTTLQEGQSATASQGGVQ